VTDDEALDAPEVPLELVAVTVYVRATPAASETVMGDEEPVAVFPDEDVTV
jgi:hypothetical protein